MKKAIKRFFGKLFLLFLYIGIIALALGLIYYGLKLNKMSKKHYVVDVTLDSIRNTLYNYGKIENQYYLGEEYSVKSNIKVNLNSEEYDSKAPLDPESAKKSNLLKNLSAMQIDSRIEQSKKDGRFIAELNEKIGEEEIFSGKYYIDNYTKYYFVNGILNSYVNDGNNNYFDLLNEKNCTMDNIDYLYNFIFESLKNNIKEEDLQSYEVEINLGEDKVNVNQVYLKITDKYIKDLLKNMLKDLKKDEKANQIITALYPNFKKVKVNTDKKYLDNKESYTINIYSRKVINKPVKYEIIHLNDDFQESFSFEGTLESGAIYYVKNNEIKYIGKCESTPKKLEVIINDVNGGEAGNIKIEKTTNSLSFNTTLDLENKNYQISYSTIYKNFSKKKSYVREDTLTCRIMINMITKINGSVIIESEVSKNVNIKEDTENAVLDSTLSEETKTSLDNLYDNIKARLER